MSTQIERQRLYAWAKAHDFPRLPLAAHLAVLPGEKGWRAYTTRADRDDILRGIGAIEAIAAREADDTAVTTDTPPTDTPDAAQPEQPEQPENTRYISHSQMDTFEQCPHRWKLEKIDKVRRAPATPLILGDAVHQALEADGKAWIDEQRRLDYVQLLTMFARALNERLAEDDPEKRITDAERETLYHKGMAVLSAYVEHIQPHYQPITVERRLETDVPDYDGLRYVGLVDGMTQPANAADGTIVDFKIISKPWRRGDEHLKDQATAYLWLTNKVEGEEGWECNPSRVTFITFPVVATEDGKGFTCTPDLRPTTRTQEQIEAYVEHVQAVAETIEWARETGNFEVRTGPLCCYCSCIESCADGLAYAEQTGRPIMVPLSRHRHASAS